MEKQEVSAKEALDAAIIKLSNILVPVAMARKIGIPIAESIDLIRMCSEAIKKKEAAGETEAQAER